MIEVTDRDLTKLRLSKKVVGGLTPKTTPVEEEIDANTKATVELVAAIKVLAERKEIVPEAQDLAPILDAIAKIQNTQKDIISVLLEQTRKKGGIST